MTFDCRRIFSERGLRFTKQRCAIFAALAQTKTHPTPEQLHFLVSDDPVCKSISLATIYNTLEALCEADLCVKLPVTHGSARYDANLVRRTGNNGTTKLTYEPAREPHLHLVDQQSGDIHDVPEDLSKRLLESIPREVVAEIEDKLGYEINRISLQFFGRPTAEVTTAASSPADTIFD